MKKYSLLLFAVIPVLAMGFSSCSKDDDDNDPKTKRELLTQSSWRYKSATSGGASYTAFLSCQTDNTISFSDSGSGVVNEGATKCDPADPQTIPFTWSFQSGELELQLSSALFDNAGATMTLVSVTETELVVNFPVSTPGPIIIVEVTFQH